MTRRSDEELFQMDLRMLQKIAQTGQVYNRLHTTTRLIEMTSRMKRDHAELLKLREVTEHLRKFLQDHSYQVALMLEPEVDSTLHHPLLDALTEAEEIHRGPVQWVPLIEATGPSYNPHQWTANITGMVVKDEYDRDAGVRDGRGGEWNASTHQQEVVVDSAPDPAGHLPGTDPQGDSDPDETGVGDAALRDASETLDMGPGMGDGGAD